jgi:RecA/RadA recombinase
MGGHARARVVINRVLTTIGVRQDWRNVVMEWVRSRGRLTSVDGPPGTGKTQSSVGLVSNINSPTRAVAFTRSDAVEFNRRLRRDCAEVETVDSLAVRFVGFESMVKHRGNIELGVDLLRREVAGEFNIEYSLDKYSPAFGNELFHAADFVINAAGIDGLYRLVNALAPVDPGAVGALEKYYACVFGRVYNVGRFKCGFYDFTIARLELALHGIALPVKSRGRDCGEPQVLVVDEAQDVSWLMWLGIIRASGDGVGWLVMAGDPDQAIYRGLHPIAVEVFEEALRVGEVVSLERSRRVPNNVAQLAQAWLRVSRGSRSPRRGWLGTEAFGSIRFVDYTSMLREVASVFNKLKVFILSPTNKPVVPTAINLMRLGIIPHFLKGVPTQFVALVDAVRELFESSSPDVGLGGTTEAEYLKAVFGLVKERFRYYRALYPDKSRDEVLGLVWRELDPGGLVYDSDPNAPLFVDTIHTAKGLEADLVFILNFLGEREREPDPTPNLMYVALTRARAGVRIVTTPGPGWKPWVDTVLLRRLAQGVVANA